MIQICIHFVAALLWLNAFKVFPYLQSRYAQAQRTAAEHVITDAEVRCTSRQHPWSTLPIEKECCGDHQHHELYGHSLTVSTSFAS